MAKKLTSINYIQLTRGGISLAEKISDQIEKKLADDGKISLQEGFEIVGNIVPEILDIVIFFVR